MAIDSSQNDLYPKKLHEPKNNVATPRAINKNGSHLGVVSDEMWSFSTDENIEGSLRKLRRTARRPRGIGALFRYPDVALMAACSSIQSHVVLPKHIILKQ